MSAEQRNEKQLPETPAEFANYLRGRASGHAPGYDIAVYARPHLWLALADALDRKSETKGASATNK